MKTFSSKLINDLQQEILNNSNQTFGNNLLYNLDNIENTETVDILRQKLKEIVVKHSKEGNNHSTQHEFVTAFNECKTLGLNIGQPAFLS